MTKSASSKRGSTVRVSSTYAGIAILFFCLGQIFSGSSTSLFPNFVNLSSANQELTTVAATIAGIESAHPTALQTQQNTDSSFLDDAVTRKNKDDTLLATGPKSSVQGPSEAEDQKVLNTSTVAFFKDRYGYTAASPRTTKHPNCTQNSDGTWQFFDLNSKERSKLREDMTIFNWFFRDSKNKGTYVELGAFDGQKESNTRFFDECLNWDGLLIEANPLMRERIFANRPHASKLFYAPSCQGHNETVGFAACMFSSSALAKQGETNKVVQVPCGPLSPVLETLLNGHVHFLSLDVEGAEPLVLKTIDWTRVRIDILIAENFNNNCKLECQSRTEVRQMMKEVGYKLYRRGVQRSDLYIHPNFTKAPPPSYTEGYHNIHRLK